MKYPYTELSELTLHLINEKLNFCIFVLNIAIKLKLMLYLHFIYTKDEKKARFSELFECICISIKGYLLHFVAD